MTKSVLNKISNVLSQGFNYFLSLILLVLALSFFRYSVFSGFILLLSSVLNLPKTYNNISKKISQDGFVKYKKGFNSIVVLILIISRDYNRIKLKGIPK